jgi:hypothetical protein
VTTWSLTPFCSELDVLEIRLAELDPVVDVHVIAEAPVTQSGAPKPLVFAENRERFAPWLDKIRHVVVEDMPTGGADWLREHHQREALSRGLDGLEPDDLVLLSDVDEIPRPDVIERFADGWCGGGDCPNRLIFPMHVYRLNWKWPDVNHSLCVCRVFRGRELPILETYGRWGVQNLRLREISTLWGEYGWHLSYMGGADEIARKIATIADDWVRAEPRWQTREHVERSIATGADVYERTARPAVWVGLDALPRHVREHAARFSHLLIDEPEVTT